MPKDKWDPNSNDFPLTGLVAWVSSLPHSMFHPEGGSAR